MKDLLFGPGYCERCGLIKSLAMVAMPGLYTDEHGELSGKSTLALDPLERHGYCKECAIAMLDEMDRRLPL